MMGYGYASSAAASACPYVTNGSGYFGRSGHMYGGYGHMFGGSSTALFWVIGLLFVALLIVGTILVIAWAARNAHPAPVTISPADDRTHTKDEAVEALRLHYAQGHISRKEYQEKKKDLL